MCPDAAERGSMNYSGLGLCFGARRSGDLWQEPFLCCLLRALRLPARPGAVPVWGQDPALLLVEPHEVPGSPPGRPVGG